MVSYILHIYLMESSHNCRMNSQSREHLKSRVAFSELITNREFICVITFCDFGHNAKELRHHPHKSILTSLELHLSRIHLRIFWRKDIECRTKKCLKVTKTISNRTLTKKIWFIVIFHPPNNSQTMPIFDGSRRNDFSLFTWCSAKPLNQRLHTATSQIRARFNPLHIARNRTSLCSCFVIFRIQFRRIRFVERVQEIWFSKTFD